jgi:hypothetical protein
MINKYITHIGKFIGIDTALAYTLIFRIGQIINGFLSVTLVSYTITKVEQGYYYTFNSLISLQIFFELGLGYVIIQFVSHEKANLNWDHNGLLNGDERSKNRLKGLVSFFVKWNLKASALLILFLILVGSYVLGSSAHSSIQVSWQLAWILTSIVTGINLVLNSFM